MVFIVLGAVKAAKHARNEYNKDKKRNTVIAPVDGSHDMMADRAVSSQSNGTGSTDWWGTSRAADAPAPTCDASWNSNIVGAWSRDQPPQQSNDESTARPPSVYASSASASTELSAPIAHSPREESASLSRLNAVKRPSQSSGDMHIRPRPASMDTPSKPSLGDSEGQFPVRYSSNGHETVEGAEVRMSMEMKDFPSRATSWREDSAANANLPTRSNEDKVPIKSMEELQERAEGEQDRAKASVQGSFAEAMQKPRASKTRISNPNPQQSSETISALSRNASKGFRRRTSQMDSSARVANGQVAQPGDGTLSAFSRDDTRDHIKRLGRAVEGVPIVQENDDCTGSFPTTQVAPRSALARNALKGPRRRLDPITNESATLGSAGRHAIGNEGLQEKQEHTTLVDAQSKEAGTGVSAFAGAPTKKRSKRVYPPKEQTLNVESNMATSDTQGAQPEPMRSSGTVTASSMYVAGSMKKRSSRR